MNGSLDAIGEWYCCVGTPERYVTNVMGVALPGTLFIGVPEAIWIAAWLLVAAGQHQREEDYLSIYMLEIVEIEIDDSPVTVVRPNADGLPYWVTWSLWVATADLTCSDGCGLSKLPV